MFPAGTFLQVSIVQENVRKLANNIQKQVAKVNEYLTKKYHPSVPNLKKILMMKWHWIENQPLLREIYKEPPFIS